MLLICSVRTSNNISAIFTRTLQRKVGLLRFPGVVDHGPASFLGELHAAAEVGLTSTVEHLVVRSDLVAVVRFAVVPEELIGRQGASLVMQHDTARCYAVRSIGVARNSVVMPSHRPRRRLKVVFVTVLYDQSQRTLRMIYSFISSAFVSYFSQHYGQF